MRICTSAPKSTERGSHIVSFDALTGLFIAMGLVLGNIARNLVLGIAVAGMPAIALAADSWSISIGVRETGTSAAIGDDGGSAGGIEWVNLDGQSIIADGLWHPYTWNFGTDPVTNFSGGNGVLSSATMKGTLEHIRILNSGANVGGAINLRVDNIVNTVGGTPMTVAGFETSEGFTTSLTSTQPMFREPIFSSSTLGNMSTGINSTLVSTIAQSGSQSMAARWSFVPDGSTSRWLRLSTASGGGNVQPNPTIDFTSGNSLTMWLRANVVNPSGTRTFGVDVSSNQGTLIDWNKVAAAGEHRRRGADVRVHSLNPRRYQRDIVDRGDAGGRYAVQLQHHQCETGGAHDWAVSLWSTRYVGCGRRQRERRCARERRDAGG